MATGTEDAAAAPPAAAADAGAQADAKGLARRAILVWGSPTVDWLNVRHGRDGEPTLGPQDVHLSAHPGGVALLVKLLEQMLGPSGATGVVCGDRVRELAEKLSPHTGTTHTNESKLKQAIQGITGQLLRLTSGTRPLRELTNEFHRLVQGLGSVLPSPLSFSPTDGRYRHTWSVWEPRGSNKEGSGSTRAYRMATGGITNWELEQEPWTGLPPDYTHFIEQCKKHMGPRERPVAESMLILDDPGVINKVIDTTNPDRTKKYDKLRYWLNATELTALKVKHVLYRLDSRAKDTNCRWMKSGLYEILREIDNSQQPNGTRPHQGLTTIITSVRHLRANGIRVGASLSWEQMLDDITKAAKASFLRAGHFRRAIVTVGQTGAVVLDGMAGGDPKPTLIFDRYYQEDDVENRHDGKVLGASTCLLAALAAAWAEFGGPTTELWDHATRRGIEMVRVLGAVGYKPSDKPKNRRVLEFPFREVIATYFLNDLDKELPKSRLGMEKLPEKLGADWTLLGQKINAAHELYGIAVKIVRTGDTALENVPVGKIKLWYSADRTEIEGVRNVQNAIRDYMQAKPRPGETLSGVPLSVAVFGPPGSGKSFVVKQIAEEQGIDKGDQPTFNLSQFESAADLAKAFHRIQDITLRGKTPLVIWDEFDSAVKGERLAWLRHFLAPMQDALFADQGEIHPVGRGIYIFAGGTSHTYADFAATNSDEERAAKKPDFVSRIRAYIDVKGPNPPKAAPASAFSLAAALGSWLGLSNPAPVATAVPESLVIRRAFLLRASLEKYAPRLKKRNNEFDVDDGVLAAFLREDEYIHGARSLDTLVAMSKFDYRTKYESSSVPPRAIIEMHVRDADAFLDRLQNPSGAP